MKIEALLERKEQLQILILRNLVLQGGTASINGLREHVQLSKLLLINIWKILN